MKKQLLLIVLLLSVAASAFAEEVEIGGLWYEVVAKAKEAKVIQYKNKVKYWGDIVIPEAVVYEGTTCSVTSIGKEAFYSCSGLTSVTIPNSVTSIGDYAFYYCSGLTSVTIPNSVTSIGDYAFLDCSGLITINVEAGNTKYDSRNNCNAIIETSSNTLIAGCKNTTIPNSVTSIGDYAFDSCFGLTSVTIPNSVTTIGRSAFSGCSGLTSVTIPNSVTSIGNYAFYNCSGLTSVTIPNSVTSIESYAFRGCSGLTSVTIGSGVKYIDDKAFANCPELTDVTCYAENVPTTNNNAFEGSYIEYVTLHVPTSSINSYKTTEPWNQFKEFKGIGGDLPKCATPTIAIVGGKLTFDCETEGVKFITDYKYNGGSTVEGKEVVLGGKTICHVTVYATKEGYENSETVTYDMELAVGKKGDTNGDGKVDVEDVVETVNIILGE